MNEKYFVDIQNETLVKSNGISFKKMDVSINVGVYV